MLCYLSHIRLNRHAMHLPTTADFMKAGNLEPGVLRLGLTEQTIFKLNWVQCTLFVQWPHKEVGKKISGPPLTKFTCPQTAFEEHSWFPGYAWRVAVCPQCGAHMGWSFEHRHLQDYMEKTSKFGDGLSSNKEQNKGNSKIVHSFVGLIYPNLIEEHYADSLIVTPKAYRG
ncbi:uncharacterized protein LOC111328060 isoform X3 [Stylophora pistillata]|uniref:uncharacterized protein LOC111328060 isoform X3 n=1 Tax=Stylophora pistillata TaxID=50429 RepID=UPI000C0462EE|nr:uncharacterized protein LOC111328060 isoform X3 [Stylophora pistillata]